MNWKCWKTKKKVKPNRRVRGNDPAFNAQFKYAKNYISTSKYNLLTFLPLNLFEQFTRLANIYFLFLLILQNIRWVTSLNPVITAIALGFVLIVSMIKDLVDDIQRHLSDRKVNNRLSWVLRNGSLVKAKWRTVGVGDIIKMENDQFVAADLLLLSSSEPSGMCFIETAELDGETNLKVKQAIPVTAAMEDNIQILSKFNGEVTCEPPNNVLSRFDGKMDWQGQSYSLDNDKILLRGCVLRNTDWCFGMVVFAGKDTKLMMNSGRTKFKRTHIDRLMNTLIIGIFIFLASMCLACCIGAGIWETLLGTNFQIYLPWDSFVPGSLLTSDGTEVVKGATVISILVFFSYIIVLNTVVPISLYISIELIRFGNSWWINWDDAMYYEKTDTPARARTTTLNEELGQIEYIFSDKTGTLTQNIMTFNKCSINGSSYGDVVDSKGRALDITDRTPKIDFSSNPFYEKGFDFYDTRLVEAVKSNTPEVHEFFRLLALCHTVMASERTGQLEYQAQSPDEAALVSAARNFGFVYKTRTTDQIVIEVMGVEEIYEQLCILDFDNVRKRMSIIVRRDNKITLLCKGADSTVYERLDPSSRDLQEQTTAHLETFAQDGLRTLCLAAKELDPVHFNEWNKRHHEASTSLENREEKLSALYEEIEQKMRLIGATAIEDKLQDGVPEAIANLANADIKIWVLTGDKQETAINIGYSCHLLTEEMSEHLYVVDADDADEVSRELMRARDSMLQAVNRSSTQGYNNPGMSVSSETLKSNMNSTFSSTFRNLSRAHEFGLILNGHSLVHALKPEMELLLLEVSCMCKAVICCRVTPLQKAMVVSLVKKHKKSITLAIGDGANDVSMIKMAHIGIGISGQEGMQAVLASDYSFAQFRFLERLLLVHGRWSYLRICKFLKYFFYKNFSFTLCHFWFSFFCGFSAQTLYDPFFITFYNIFYTSLPVIALGLFDQDVSDKISLQYPRLYTPGHLDLFFNKKVFAQSVLEGFLTSLVLFFVPYGAYQDAIQANGLDVSGHRSFGVVVATCLVVTVTLRCGLDTLYWTPINQVFLWGSILFFFGFTAVFYLEKINYPYSGIATVIWSSATFWFTLLLTVVIILMSVIAERFYFIDTRPTLTDKLRVQQKIGEIKEKVKKSKVIRRASTVRRSQRSVGRSGYAFSHQQGFGDLITSGSLMKKTAKKRELIPDFEDDTNAASLVGYTDLTGLQKRSTPPRADAIIEENRVKL